MRFVKINHTFKWECFSVWKVGNGTVDCFYDTKIELHHTKTDDQNKDLQKLLKNNPFMTKESIHKLYERKLKEYLDSKFVEYCACDRYYEPVMEDGAILLDISQMELPLWR